ncbi:MAG: peptidase dimerization domain protein [Bacteroidetes bacterium]|nr:peptidase dimerization domain protein [Bacteroidota bacterium]
MELSEYLKHNESRIFDELFSLIVIPSVSAQSEHKADMLRCARRWQELLSQLGMDTSEVMPTDGNPVVFAEKRVGDGFPTILIYGHYDVMPVEPLELWHSNPFEPIVKDGKIWARGADDDKGQSFMHAKAIEYLLKEEILPCNVKFIVEGEEEIGSGSLETFCQTNKELLKADVILVSDTSMLSEDIPSITTGLRGLAYWQVEVTGPCSDLHSGIFGGAVANPINELCKLIASLTDDQHRITVPDFYDDVEEVSVEERDSMSQIPFDEEMYKASLKVQLLQGETGYSTLERTGIRPTFDVCGIWGGYSGEGAKTVLPSKAYAKLSCRLVPHQNHVKIGLLMKYHLESIAPKSITIDVKPIHGGDSYVCPIDIPWYKAAEAGYTKAFGKKPLPVRRGGSIPVIATFEKVLGVKTVLMGFGLESNAIHSPNENFPVDLFFKGITAIVEFYNQIRITNK